MSTWWIGAGLSGALCAGLVVGCGGSNEEEPPEPASTESAAGAAENRPGNSLLPGSSPGAPGAAEVAVEQVPLNDLTPEDAMGTYMRRLLAGDFRGAAEVCVEGSAGAERLVGIESGWERAAADNVDIGQIKQLMTGAFKTMTWEKIADEEETAVFEVKSPTKDPTLITVTLVEGVWRVEPPATGMP